MKMRSLYSFAVTVILFMGLTANAQTFQLQTSVSGPVTVCGDEVTFTVTITKATSGAYNDIRLMPNLPEGMEYIPGTATGMIEVLPNGGLPLQFIVQDFSTGQIAPTFNARATCELIQTLKSTGSTDNLINNQTELTFSSGGQSFSITEQNGSTSYSVLFTEFELSVPDSEKNMVATFINKMMSRHITLANTGLGSIKALTFYVKVDQELQFQKLEAQSNSGPLLLNSSGSSALGMRFVIADFSLFGDGDNVLEEGESIVLTDFVSVKSEKGAIATQYTAQWGCDLEVCNVSELQSTLTTYIEAIGGAPEFVMSHEVVRKTDLCNDPAGYVQFFFTNTGSANSLAARDGAFDVKLRLAKQGTQMQDQLSFHLKKSDNSLFDVDNLVQVTQFTHQINQFTTLTTHFDIDLSNKFTTDVDGPGGLSDLDGDGFFDDLLPGETIVIETHIVSRLNETILVNEGQRMFGFQMAITCNRWGGQIDGLGTAFFTDEFIIQEQSFFGTTDFIHQKRDIVTLEVRAIVPNLNSLIDYEKGLVEYLLEVPNGLILKKVNSSIPFNQQGTSIRITSSSILQTLKLEFELDCAKATSFGPATIQATAYFYTDFACVDSRVKFAEIQKGIILHCGTCSSTETTLFSVERKTLGWVPPPYQLYRYGQLFGPNANALHVTRSTPGIRLDAAYPKDEVEALIQGRAAGSISNLYAEVTYESPSIELLKYARATFVVGRNEYSFPSDYTPEKTQITNKYIYKFQVPIGQPGWPSTVPQNFELKVTFVVDEMDDIERGIYPLANVRGSFYSVVNGANTGCLGYGDEFTILKPLSEIGSRIYGVQVGEDKKVFVGSLSIQWSNLKDGSDRDFPNEFRPLIYGTSFIATLPQGFVFDPSAPVQFKVDHGNLLHTLSDAQFSPDRRTVTIQLSENTPIVQKALDLTATLSIDCSQDNLFIPSNAEYDVRPYEDLKFSYNAHSYLPQSSQHNNSGVIDDGIVISNIRRPRVLLSANSVQEGYSETVRWPIQICTESINTFSARSPNTWVAFELKDDDSSTILLGAEDQNGNVLPVTFYGPIDDRNPKGRYMLVKVGNVVPAHCYQFKAIATYTSCENDVVREIGVIASWDYFGYPYIDSYRGKIEDNMPGCEGNIYRQTMAIKYKTADLQWEIRQPGPQTSELCVGSPFEIDLASTLYGDMRDLKVWFDLPPNSAVDHATASFHYPYNASASLIPSDAFIVENGRNGIDVSKILGGNLPGIRLAANKIKLAFNIVTACGYDPGLPLTFSVTGLTNCGAPVSYTDQRKINLVGFSPAEMGELALSLTGPETLTCNTENTLNVAIKNTATVQSRANRLEVILPEGTSFQQITTGDLGNPTVSSYQGKVRLVWPLVQGYLLPDETKSFSFLINTQTTPPDQGTITINARVYNSANAYCAINDGNCDLEATIGRTQLSLPVSGLASLQIESTKLLCAYQFSARVPEDTQCDLLDFRWDLGDGTITHERRPLHTYSTTGSKTVSVSVVFKCENCTGTETVSSTINITPPSVDLENVTVDIPSDKKSGVLQVSASIFSDAWPTQILNPSLESTHSLLNGTEGVWRNHATYVYQANRKSSENPRLDQDGSFELNHFNWQYAELNAVPGWIRATSMTQYSPFSYELETQDALGIYSSALYDYGGHLPSANGVNMRNNEMAFTSFETVDSQDEVGTDASTNNVSGNLIFKTSASPDHIIYKVNNGTRSIAVVEASMEELEGVTTVGVVGRNISPFFWGVHNRFVADNEIVCMSPYPAFAGWTLVVLREPMGSNMWRGELKVTKKVASAVVPSIRKSFAHTGVSSLEVSGEKTFPQPLLHLDKNKKYVFSGWVSVDQIPSLPTISPSTGVSIVTKNKQGQVISTEHIEPQGPIIEGWQQVKGTLVYTGDTGSFIELVFKSGTSSIAWFDDIRIHPEQGNMKSYVYNLTDYRLRAVLDEENYASFYYYDAEGNLYLVKKETERGIVTVSENISNLRED